MPTSREKLLAERESLLIRLNQARNLGAIHSELSIERRLLAVDDLLAGRPDAEATLLLQDEEEGPA